MLSLLEFLEKIARTPNRPMAWGRVPANHLVGAKVQPSFVPNDDYFIVRLSSMFLKDSRVLWLKLSPLAHAVVSATGRTKPRTETAIIGPAQFGDLAAASASRTVILNQRLAGPSVWRGGELQLAAGLFAVPKDQAARALLDTVGQLSALAIPGAAPALEIAKVVKAGVEGLIGLDGTKAVLAVKDAFVEAADQSRPNSAAPCLLAAIAAPAAEVNFDELWVKDGLLQRGASASALTPYIEHDHLLIALERGPARQDWRGMPVLTPHEAAFDTILRSEAEKPKVVAELNAEFTRFDASLAAEEELTEPDKARIRNEVVAAISASLKRKFSGVFGVPETRSARAVEERSIGGIKRTVSLTGFNLLDVGDMGPEQTRQIQPSEAPF